MIRQYHPKDCESVLNVWATASAVAHPFLGEEFLQQERCNIQNLYLPQAQTWVWEADAQDGQGGQVVGFISLLGNEVGGLFVAPPFHGLGIGRALIAQAQSLQGALEVDVFERNLMGRAFYARLGFVLMCKKLHAQMGLALLRLRLAAGHPQQPMSR